MSAKAHVNTFLLILFLIVTPLLGCTVSEDSGTSSASNSSTVRLAIATTTGATTLPADGSSSVPIQITVTDGSGQGVPNTVVTFSTTAGTLSIASGTAAARTATGTDALADTRSNHTSSVITGSDGTAQVILSSSTTVETAMVTAQAMGFSTAMTVDFISSMPDQIAIIATSSIVGIGSTTTVRATVTDADGIAVEGVTVMLSFTSNTSGGSLSGTSGKTDANGQFTVTYTAGTSLGTDTIKAEVSDTISDTTTITVQTLTISASATSTTVGIASTTSVQATVSDDTGTAVEGVTVTFSITDNVSGSTLSATSGITDANGQVTVTYTAGTSLGTDTIQVKISDTISDTMSITVQAAAVEPASLELLVSSPQLDSDNSESVTLTALVRDSNNNFVSGTTVSFAADSGGIQVTNGTTDSSGTATALLFTAGDPSNRTITITATAGALSSTNTVTVTGTTVTLSGSSALVLGETTTLSILLRDSGGNGIANQSVTISSALGNTLSAATVNTDSNGQATFQVTADVAGADTITTSALGATGSLSLTISSANFVFTAPTSGAEVNLGAVQTITVHWDEGGVNQVGQTINFFATRGTLSAASASTDANGNASVTITSSNAGPAAITAAATTSGGPSSQIVIEFVATTPANLIIQASPTTVGINAQGTSDQQSIITAVVRDASGNLVKNQTVSFTLTDVSGGSIFPASAITDSFGRASTVYTAGAASSAQDGVLIDAEVAGTVGCTPTDPIPSGPCDRVTLTVAQQTLFVTLGTSHLIQPLSDTQYAKPYSVLVTDANGNPIEGAMVELNIYATRYQKGVYTQVFDLAGNCLGWAKSLSVSAASLVPHLDNDDQACNNEDVNRNGLLNLGEDINNNGTLEPGMIATAPTNVITDETGFALFDVVYAREFTWVEIEIEARATVAGSESSSKARFFLPGLADDFNDCDVAPPGQTSPYGVATTCACDELTDPTCPT